MGDYNIVKKDAKRFLLSSALVTVFDIIRNIVVANMLGPYLTGLCSTIMIIPQIGLYSNFGLTDAMTVLVPNYKGRGNFKASEDLKGLVFNTSILASILSFVIVIFYISVFPVEMKRANFFAVLAGFLIILWHLKKFFVTLYAAENNFKKYSLIEFSFSVVVTFFQILLVYFFEDYGFWFGFIVPNIIIIVYAVRDHIKTNTIKFFHVDLWQIKSIVPLGITMLICGVTYTPYMIVSRAFLAKAAGVKEVGYFVLAMMILPKVSIISNAISRVILPKISQLHAEKDTLDKPFKLFVKAQLYTLGMTTFVFVLGVLSLERVVSIIMPKYILGVPAAQLMLLASIPYCLIDNANNFLLALQRKRIYLVNLTLTFIFQILALFLLYYRGGVSAYNVSMSLVVVFSFYALIANLTVVQLHRDDLKLQRMTSNENFAVGISGTKDKLSVERGETC